MKINSILLLFSLSFVASISSIQDDIHTKRNLLSIKNDKYKKHYDNHIIDISELSYIKNYEDKKIDDDDIYSKYTHLSR